MAAYLREIKDHVERTNQYYDFVSGLYLQFYGEHFHMCFQQPGEPRDVAIERMNEMILDDAQLSPASHVVDLGGGIGSLCKLAVEKTGCSATCVNISDQQIAMGRKAMRKAGLDIPFLKQDIMDLSSEEPYDSALLIGVDCHIPDKRKMLRSISRVLRSGGRLVIAAWLQREDPTALEKEFFLRELYRCVAFSNLANFTLYRALFDELKFKVVRFEDRTTDIEHYVDYLYREQLRYGREGMPLEKMISFMANRKLLITAARGKLRDAVEDAFRGVLYLKLCYDAGLFKYGYFVVEGP